MPAETATGKLLVGHRRERRRRRHRPGLGRDLQGRVPQPPELRRALPGRGDRRRRHRARHHLDGRAPGRGHGLVAVRRDRRTRTPIASCPGSSPASGATATASACPTSAARSSSTRATRATRSSTRSCVGVAAARGPAPRQRDRRRQPGRAVRRAHRRRRHRRRQRAGLGDVRRRRAGQAPSGAGRRPVRREGAHRVLPRALRAPIWSRASRTSAAPDSPARPASSPSAGDGGHARLARPGAAARLLPAPGGDPHERVAGAHDGRRRARATSTTSWRSAGEWDVLATVVGES